MKFMVDIYRYISIWKKKTGTKDKLIKIIWYYLIRIPGNPHLLVIDHLSKMRGNTNLLSILHLTKKWHETLIYCQYPFDKMIGNANLLLIPHLTRNDRKHSFIVNTPFEKKTWNYNLLSILLLTRNLTQLINLITKVKLFLLFINPLKF